MNERITDARVQYLIDNSDTWWAGGISCGDADDIDTALTELLALRAEVSRLRAVEQAARAHLDNTAWRSLCHGCNVFWHGRGHAPGCTQTKLHAALDANKQEPGT